MAAATADLYDAHGENLRVMAPLFRDYGGHASFEGTVVTLKVFEDNSLVRTALEEPGCGRVLVVDGGGSLRCALVGDLLAALGVQNGWAGILVYGCIRDGVPLSRLAIGVKALASNPRKSVKKGLGARDVLLRFADVRVNPGDYLYADADGVVIAAGKLD
ncbi:MAG: RraA family protein [Gammaproteobacteria bacterium]|nr:RraA family protein [Gammaproteobacteria bacterium]